MSLSAVLDDSLESCIVVQTSLSTPWLPFVHSLVASSSATVICVCILHPPEVVLPAKLRLDMHRVKVVDQTGMVPYFENINIGDLDSAWGDLSSAVLDAIADAPPGPVTLIVDSPDTLREDLRSTAKAHTYLHDWHAALTSRPAPTRTILPLPTHSPLLPRILTPAFAPALAHLTLHPPALLRHLATSHLAPAPPHPRFWALLAAAPIAQAEQLVWGVDGAGWASTELAVEILVRRPRGRRVERAIEGWPCALADLAALRGVWGGARPNPSDGAADPTRDLSFNLVLTDAQQRARAQVPLPYVHTAGDGGVQKDAAAPVAVPPRGTIMYDPDSADDLDDDDPDEDLDI